MSYHIEAISCAALPSFLSDMLKEKEGVIAISPERARSQQENPHARADEPCLWVARDSHGKVLGFAGSLPGYNVNSGQRLGWNTCWWSDPQEGRECAMPLLGHFLKHWELQVAFADLSAHTHSIIRAMGFCHTREEDLYRVMLRWPLHKMVRKGGWAGKVLEPMLFPFVALVNGMLQKRICRARTGSDDVRVQCREEMDEELYRFISEHAGGDLHLRSLEEWQWIDSASWLAAPGPEARSLARRYPFSYIATDFRRFWILGYVKEELRTAMLLSVREGFAKLLYQYGSEPEHALAALQQVLCEQRKIYSLVFAHPALVEVSPAILKMGFRHGKRKRYVGVSRSVREDFPEDLHIQLGDGDALFT
jgi:hypothetical protein